MIYIVSLFLILVNASNGEKIVNCRKDQIKFEKIIGLRPSPFFKPILLHESANEPITKMCIDKCLENVECTHFVLLYNNSSCFWFKSEESVEDNGILDKNAALFVKICVNKGMNCNRLWIFERVLGATFIGYNTKSIKNVIKREECQQLCLNETDFGCRSAKFKLVLDIGFKKNVQGTCILSNSDRHISPSSYRISNYDEEYLANQCVNEINDENCEFEEYVNVEFMHVDMQYNNVTKVECQLKCQKSVLFICRAFSLIPLKQLRMFTCNLHSEDIKLHGPELLKAHQGASYFERAPCLNISTTCTQTTIVIKFQPSTYFSGKMYMNGFSESSECYAIGNKTNLVTLSLNLIKYSCGFLEANSPLNRTLMSATMILQYNPFVQTQADRVINVGCIFGNNTDFVLGAGYNLTNSNNSGVTNIINKSIVPLVEMRVINLNNKDLVMHTQIGEELQFVIETQKILNSIDIWASHLVAMTEHGEESILLIDDSGCPANLDVFPGLKKNTTNNSIKLYSNFKAFKFSTSNIIRFNIIVHLCNTSCPIVECESSFNNKVFVRKNMAKTRHYLQNTNFNDMSLWLNLVVDKNTKADSLMYGENDKILVAGFDYSNNEVCIDIFILIGIVITWILIQIILTVSVFMLIKKYRTDYEDFSESLEELQTNIALGSSNMGSNRRVKFADEQ